MSEIFIAGDPRWLSGGAMRNTAINYSNLPPRIAADERTLTTASITEAGRTDVVNALRDCNQSVHSGRSGYHSRPPMNVFLDGENPTVGVELETEEKLSVSKAELISALTSNWFHFESDSSLAYSGHEGFELITEPLPPRVYRDLRTWTGLQNILTPWVESYSHKCTGLHVHVGLEQFRTRDDLRFDSQSDRMWAGKYIAAATYLCLVDRALGDAVFLRRNTEYCKDNSNGMFGALAELVDSGAVTARMFVDNVLSEILGQFLSVWQGNANTIACNIRENSSYGVGTYISGGIAGFDGHSAEVNCHNQMTVEFRRGKGTLNALSIHRMVEFTTHIVKYVMHMLDHPEEKVSKKAFASFLVENTNSEALKALAKKGI